MTQQVANQELLNQQTLSLPSESYVVNDIVGKKLREDLWKCAQKSEELQAYRWYFPSYTVTEDWEKKKRRTEKVNG